MWNYSRFYVLQFQNFPAEKSLKLQVSCLLMCLQVVLFSSFSDPLLGEAVDFLSSLILVCNNLKPKQERPSDLVTRSSSGSVRLSVEQVLMFELTHHSLAQRLSNLWIYWVDIYTQRYFANRQRQFYDPSLWASNIIYNLSYKHRNN